jgi:hypothetical protein
MPKTMSRQRNLSAVGLWWRWVLTTLVGVVIGNIFGIAACLAGVYYLSDRLVDLHICSTGFGNLNCPVATGIVSGAICVGTLVGLMQYLVLRRFFQAPAWWILVSAFGWTWIGFAATSLAYTSQFGFVINADGSFAESNIMARLPLLVVNCLWLVFAGICLGVLQWLVLWSGTRPKIPKRRSLWWIIVNAALITFVAVSIMAIFRGWGSLHGIFWFFLGFTPFYATITAATLVKMRLHIFAIPSPPEAVASIPLSSEVTNGINNQTSAPSQLEN